MLGYVQDMVSYFGEKLARFALGLSGFAEMNPTDQSYLIKDRWLVSFMVQYCNVHQLTASTFYCLIICPTQNTFL